MPASNVPTDVNEPSAPTQASPEANPESGSPDLGSPASGDSTSPSVRGSRWVDYDTHELLEMISDLEDERRWARLREGMWIAILIHLVILSFLTWIPKYIFKVPQVVDQTKTQQDKDFTYLDSPPEALLNSQPKVAIKPPAIKPPVIDRQTLDALNKAQTPAPPAPAPAPAPVAPPAVSSPIPPPVAPAPQPQVESPRPAAVPARPNFAMGSQNPADQLRDAMRGAAHNPGSGNQANLPSGGLAMHPGAGTGGLEVLSDTQGVDFSNWIQRWHWETQHTWDPLIPDEVNAPINKSGMVAIRFKVLPNGRLMDGSLQLEGRSGDSALDRAAWGALTGSNYPPLPREFHGPYLELRAYFLYNMEPPSR